MESETKHSDESKQSWPRLSEQGLAGAAKALKALGLAGEDRSSSDESRDQSEFREALKELGEASQDAIAEAQRLDIPLNPQSARMLLHSALHRISQAKSPQSQPARPGLFDKGELTMNLAQKIAIVIMLLVMAVYLFLTVFPPRPYWTHLQDTLMTLAAILLAGGAVMILLGIRRKRQDKPGGPGDQGRPSV